MGTIRFVVAAGMRLVGESILLLHRRDAYATALQMVTGQLAVGCDVDGVGFYGGDLRLTRARHEFQITRSSGRVTQEKLAHDFKHRAVANKDLTVASFFSPNNSEED